MSARADICRYGAHIVLLLALCAPGAVHADAREGRANAAYAEERFDDAARELEALIAERGYSPEVLRELGEAYRRQGETGLAVLAYERARLLAPTDPDIVEGLRATRREAELAAPPESTLEALASLWPARRWLLGGAIGLGIFCLGALMAGALRRARWLGLLVALPGLACVVASGVALWVGTLGVARAVVIADDAAARVSPFAQADALFTVRAGELVRVEGAHGEHVRVVMPDGAQGWVARDALEAVVPGALR